MDKYPVMLDGGSAGELSVTEAGMYWEFRAACRREDGQILRAFLVGEGGELLLGVLAPENGELAIRRRISRRDAAAVGKLLRCEVRRERGQTAAGGWEAAAAPETLLRDPFFRERLRGLEGALTRKTERGRAVAAPWDPKRPFPLTALFCFARIQTIGERRYAVFSFDAQERPAAARGAGADGRPNGGTEGNFKNIEKNSG